MRDGLPRITTERLLLRPVEPTDLDAFAPWMADPDVVRFIGGETLTSEQTAERIAAWRARFDRDGFGQFALVRRADDVVVGRCGLLVWQLPDWTITTLADAVQPHELELGWTLGKEHWGLGYATEAATAVRDFVFDELGFDRLISLIAVENRRSAAVAERLGMVIEGATRLHDLEIDIWALTRDS